ncbi:MAG TPA: hypothetical protein PLL33_06465 [Paracoccus sp. (in: a-proteobacteria)]|nr:hypothetical protein [Paracoccus sp. (in: a-proteobacteria)]
MFSASSQMRSPERPPLHFDAIILQPPPGWTGWGRLRVTALNHATAAADLGRICRPFRPGGRIVTMLEVAEYDGDSQQEIWSRTPRGGRLRCSDISEYHVPPATDGQPGIVSFEALIRPGKGIGKLGYRVHYRWTDRPGETESCRVQP